VILDGLLEAVQELPAMRQTLFRLWVDREAAEKKEPKILEAVSRAWQTRAVEAVRQETILIQVMAATEVQA
jgi:hypothetical protein